MKDYQIMITLVLSQITFYGLHKTILWFKYISVNFLVTTCFSVIINLARRICQVSLGQGQILFHLIENVAEKERNLRRTACSKIDQFKLLMIIREKRCL